MQAHPGYLDGVLRGQEEPQSGTFERRQAEKVLAVECHGTAEHLVPRLAHQDVCEGALARTVGAHDGMNLTAPHHEVDAGEHLQPGHAGPESADNELVGGLVGVLRHRSRRRHGSSTSTSSPSIRTP